MGEPIAVAYANILKNPDLNQSEKAGYLLAVSRVDPRFPEMTIQEARAIVEEHLHPPGSPGGIR